ncbi:hypothetical protein STEG23_023199, partial [Scotinomys teguina]
IEPCSSSPSELFVRILIYYESQISFWDSDVLGYSPPWWRIGSDNSRDMYFDAQSPFCSFPLSNQIPHEMLTPRFMETSVASVCSAVDSEKRSFSVRYNQ